MKRQQLIAAAVSIIMLTGCGNTIDYDERRMQTKASPDLSAADEIESTTTASLSETTTTTTAPETTTTTTTTTAKATTPKTTTTTTTTALPETTTTTTTTTTATTTTTTTTTTAATTVSTTAAETSATAPETTPPQEGTAVPKETTSKKTESRSETVSGSGKETETVNAEAPATTLFFVNTSNSATHITWDPVPGADGYVVAMKKMKDMDWEELTDTTELGYDIKGIGIDRNYIFTVKAYKNSGGKKIFSERSRNCAFPYMTQKDGITYVDGLIIVNKTYSLPRSFGVGLSSGTQTAFNEMKAGAKADGLDIWIASGFRSYDTQYNLYWNYVARDGSQWSADRYSARPGYSEHQSGFAIDVNQASRYFNGSPVALWLKDNCWKYGFIIRYPEGKEDITGYNYESWHVRYVGKEKAKRITESGLTLEEYYGLTSRYAE